MREIALIIDADNYLHRQYAGGAGTASADNLMKFVAAYTSMHRPFCIVACFDAPGETWRHREFPGYKAGREEKEPGLLNQKAVAMDALHKNLVTVRQVAGAEADDLIGDEVEVVVNGSGRAVIVSSDKDLWQFLRDGLVTALTKANRWHGEWTFDYMTAGKLFDKHGLTPAQWLDYRVLAGDSSDGWPGAKGIGDKAAKAIIDKAGSLEAAMNNLWSLPITGKQREALGRFDWKLGRRLLMLGGQPVAA